MLVGGAGMPQSQVLGDILLHLFNHQTHYRGQACACLSILTGTSRHPLIFLFFSGVPQHQILKRFTSKVMRTTGNQ